MDQFIFVINWWIFCSLIMVLLWVYQCKHKDAGIADVGWSYCLAGASFYFLLVGEGDQGRRILLALFGGVWGGQTRNLFIN